ncbi:MAG TPA: anhydro-N-acetylmuramic acid kinase [Terriglobales bacterium]|jgi:anhydro-N-acetylmuramic acid kinase
MIVAGVMSGTSVDGTDVSLVRITRASPRSLPTLKLLGHKAFPYPADVRRRILVSMNSPRASVADLARLNFLLGELYAEAVIIAQKKIRVKAELVGCHGQTLYHQGIPADFLGRKLAVTWQTGEGAVIAARTGLPVVSDFRPADMARGGKGAPLVPYLDYLLYRDRKIGRIALNLGGIANLTAVPAAAAFKQVVAFDTGPGNMVIDALAGELFGQECDLDGKIAASGRVFDDVVARFLTEDPFFSQKPPRTAGREEFGREFAREFLHAARPLASRGAANETTVEKRDVIATATALTVRSIVEAVRRFVPSRGNFTEMIVSGGGAKNPTLMSWLSSEVRPLGLRLRSSDEFGIPSSAKEAVAFAVLAYETWNRRPSNVPSATGAKRPAVLGKVSYP